MDKDGIKQLLHNYPWMIQTIALKRSELNDITGQNLTAQYGIEATLPKGKGTTSDPIYFEVLRREQKTASIKDLEQKAQFIQQATELIKDDKQKLVLNKIMDGRSLRSISRSTQIPLTNVARIRDNIVEVLFDFYQEQTKQQAH